MLKRCNKLHTSLPHSHVISRFTNSPAPPPLTLRARHHLQIYIARASQDTNLYYWSSHLYVSCKTGSHKIFRINKNVLKN